MHVSKSFKKQEAHRHHKINSFRNHIYLHMIVFAGMLYLLIFNYIPMVGIIISFKDYNISSGLAGFFTSHWVGLKHFSEFFTDYKVADILRNTLAISFLKMIFTFPAPIIFALMLNEMNNGIYKKFVQTVSYLPHFISWVVVSGIAFALLSTSSGVLNQALLATGLVSEPIAFLTKPEYFWSLAVISDIWKGFGWWAIIFLAAIAGINPSLYEAAEIDGAGRIARIAYVTLPGIQSAIIVVLVLSLGGLLGGGLSGSNFEQSYLLGNSLNIDRSEIIQTYVIKVGLADGRFDYASAVGLIQSTVSVTLIFVSNSVSRRLTGSSVF